ncbi:hypothetical protein BJF78_17385 [Pseudonocardia sp. CNS-139]|nr:hypothetical protein BJF78_17385 [Pseudonocardia sp. CNS-139]
MRPLLPGAPGCLVLVTSRDRLTSLVALDGARSVRLDTMDRRAAYRLLVARLGRERTDAEPAAAEEILRRCAGLPLALAVVATRAATHPSFTLADLAAELRSQCVLDAFSGDDAALDVREVFTTSYQRLGTEAARMFRVLAGHPDPDFTIPTAASLLALPPDRVRALTAELYRADLLLEHSPGRYSYHDLLRTFAAELGSGLAVHRS